MREPQVRTEARERESPHNRRDFPAKERKEQRRQKERKKERKKEGRIHQTIDERKRQEAYAAKGSEGQGF